MQKQVRKAQKLASFRNRTQMSENWEILRFIPRGIVLFLLAFGHIRPVQYV